MEEGNKAPKLKESTTEIKGLPIKYTSAPRFVFLNERQGKNGGVGSSTHDEEEQEDEFADLFRKYDVPDLTSHERSYINKFQQLGFWRKKFDNVPQPKSSEE